MPKRQSTPKNKSPAAPLTRPPKGEKVEDVLRKGMFKLGNLVERVIGHAQKAHSSVASTAVMEPILALESHLTIPKLKELIRIASQRIAQPLIPSLVDKSVVEISEGGGLFASYLKERGATTLVHVDINEGGGHYPAEARKSEGIKVGSKLSRLPFEDGFFDFVIGLLATPAQGELGKTIKELSRILTVGGYAILVDFHPFGGYARKGSARLRPLEATVKGIEDYYKLCRISGLKVLEVKEAFIDETLRSSFTSPEEKSTFRVVKNSPLILGLLVRKGLEE